MGAPKQRLQLTTTQWLICFVAALGFAFDIYELLMLPLIAQRTKQMRVGVMGNVLPYHTPWRMVEEFGMLDNLCGGRLEIGITGNGSNTSARV